MQPHLNHLLAGARRRDLTGQAERARAFAPRPRNRLRAILAAVLAAAFAALALPAIGKATTATVVGTQLALERGSAADSAMTITLRPDGRSLVTDSGEAISLGTGCAPAPGGVLCSGANRIFVGLGHGNDTLTNIGSLPTQYFGGPGDDLLVTGTGPGASQVTFNGGDGRDTVSYAAAARGVTVDLDRFPGDGRTGQDRDNIGEDVEVLQGTRFDDKLTASSFEPGGHRFVGLTGDDELVGGSGNDIFLTGPTADGADRIDGNLGFDTVDYGSRTRCSYVKCFVFRASGADAVRTRLVANGAPPDVAAAFRPRHSRAAGRAGDGRLLPSSRSSSPDPRSRCSSKSGARTRRTRARGSAPDEPGGGHGRGCQSGYRSGTRLRVIRRTSLPSARIV